MLYSASESPLLQNSRKAAGLSYFRSAITDHILVSYQASGTGSGWLQSLSDNCVQSFAQLRARKKQAFHNEHLFRSAIVSMVDKIMDKLHYFALQFNLEVGWDLHVSTTRPTFVTEVVHYNFRREPIETITIYRARLSTRLWSLVIRGHGPLIEFFVLPAQIVIGLSRSESHHRPILELRAMRKQDDLHWFLNGRDMSADQLQEVCETAFKNLIARCLHDSSYQPDDDDHEPGTSSRQPQDQESDRAFPSSTQSEQAHNVRFFDYEATRQIDFHNRSYFDYDTAETSEAIWSTAVGVGQEPAPSAAQFNNGEGEYTADITTHSSAVLPQTFESEGQPAANITASTNTILASQPEQRLESSTPEVEEPAPPGRKMSVGRFLERLHAQMMARAAQQADADRQSPGKDLPAQQGDLGSLKTFPQEIKATASAVRESATDITEAAADFKSASAEIKGAALDLKEAACEIKDSAPDLISASSKLRSAACDLKESASEILPGPRDPSNRTMDSTKEMTLPPSSPDSQPDHAAKVEGEFIMTEDHFANVISAMDFLLEEIELDISLIGHCGAEAFRARDMRKVQDLCAKAKEKTEFKFTVVELREKWERLEEIQQAAKAYLHEGQTSASLISSVSLRRPVGVLCAFDTVLESLELLLDLFGRIGAQSFAARDFNRVEASRSQSMDIIDFQAQFHSHRKQWQSSSPESDIKIAPPASSSLSPAGV